MAVTPKTQFQTPKLNEENAPLDSWEFDNDIEPGAWIWVCTNGATTRRSVGSFASLKGCVHDAKKNGYVMPFAGGPIPLPVSES